MTASAVAAAVTHGVGDKHGVGVARTSVTTAAFREHHQARWGETTQKFIVAYSNDYYCCNIGAQGNISLSHRPPWGNSYYILNSRPQSKMIKINVICFVNCIPLESKIINF